MAGNIKRALAVEKTHIPDTTRNAWFTWRYVVPETSKSNEISTVVKEQLTTYQAQIQTQET